jgi:hypothetical protein
MERENLHCVTPLAFDGRREGTSHKRRQSRGREYRYAGQDGAARSSVEARGAGAKGLRCSALAEPMDEAKPFLILKREVWEAFRRVKGQPGSGWRKRTIDRRLRGQPVGQPLQALESNVLRELLPAAGAGASTFRKKVVASVTAEPRRTHGP